MKKLFKYVLPVFAIVALASCSDDDGVSNSTPVDPYNGKELIAFSQEGSGMTRAALTRAGFSGNTKIVIRIKADENGGSGKRFTQAIATAGAETTEDDGCNVTGYLGTGVRHSHLTYNSGQNRFWDDAFGRASQLTVYAVAVPNVNSTSATTRLTGQALISDDILNQASPSAVDENTNPNWYTIASSETTKINWTVSTKQTSTTLTNEDLVYSNNIRSGESTNKGRYHQSWGGSAWTKSMELGQMIWQSKDPDDATVTVGKFDQGHLIFQHALTKIEICLNEGSGFNSSSADDFIWTNKPAGCAQNITLTGFKTGGDLDLSKPINDASLWTGQTTSSIQQLEETVTGTNTKKRTLVGYVVPGTDLDDVSTNLIEFEIDDAKYYVTGDQIATAIQNFYSDDDYAASVKTLAGKHYIINLVVGKKQIDNITAAVLDWETVNSTNIDAKNTYCDFTFEERNTKVSSDLFNLYRKEITLEEFINNGTEANHVWETGYNTTAATKSYDTDHWTTGWFWKDNKTYYHFRAAGLNASGNVTINTAANDNFNMSYGPIDNSGAYKDYLWGAPFVDVADDYKFNYDYTNGFAYQYGNSTYQISPAIGATTDRIHMLLFHMTSQIFVNLTTTTGEDKVVLHVPASDNGTPEDDTDDIPEKKTTVKIVNFLPTGKVYLGNGLVVADGDRVAAGVTMTDGTANDAASPKTYTGFSYGMVPQDLTGAWGTIGLEITTPDNNTYYVRDLSTVTGSVSTTNLRNPYSGSGPYNITKWYPNYQYTYNITLKKKGIFNITAAVLPWETVVGNNINIDLEN